MDSYSERLTAQINAELDGLAEQGEPWVAKWVAHTICNAHKAALLDDGDDTTFWLWTGYSYVRKWSLRSSTSARALPRSIRIGTNSSSVVSSATTSRTTT